MNCDRTPYPGLRLVQAMKTTQEMVQEKFDAAREAVADFVQASDDLPDEQAQLVRAHLEAADLSIVEAGLVAEAEVPELNEANG